MDRPALLPEDLKLALATETRGERLLWSGRSSPLVAFLKALPAWLMGVPWLALSGFMEFAIIGGMVKGWPGPPGSPWQVFAMIAAMLFVGVFVLIGIAMVAAPFLSWFGARRSVHFVTDRRIGTISCLRVLKVKSFPMRSIARTERWERRDGSGTLKIVTGVHRDNDGDRVEESETYHGISDVKRVERLIQDAADLFSREAGPTQGHDAVQPRRA